MLSYGALEIGVVVDEYGSVVVVLRVFAEENERVWAVMHADSIGDLRIGYERYSPQIILLLLRIMNAEFPAIYPLAISSRNIL